MFVSWERLLLLESLVVSTLCRLSLIRALGAAWRHTWAGCISRLSCSGLLSPNGLVARLECGQVLSGQEHGSAGLAIGSRSSWNCIAGLELHILRGCGPGSEDALTSGWYFHFLLFLAPYALAYVLSQPQ